MAFLLRHRRAWTKEIFVDPERWQEVRRILDATLNLPTVERPAFVAEQAVDEDLRREVLSLVKAFEAGVARLGRPVVTAADVGRTGQRVGSYELLDSVGEGGMGTVYRAHRVDDEFRKEVAVKLLRPGRSSDELLRRFRSERQILANLEHPHIARLLDGGSSDDGLPFLVMECVDGVPIDTFCRGLDIGGRVRLFVTVCDAVQFAHRHLVVHRDLKPANVLVTADGVPKLLDFGIAKILSPESFPQTVVPTATGVLPMTPEYGSPEQVLGRPITTATDVYSLGVLLYELLTGRRPYEISGAGLDAIVDAVCHRQPERPSTIQIRDASDDSPSRDLDAIVLKAMRKEPEARYASAGDLAADLRRYLDGQPVTARRGTWSYRASKFVRRHRWAMLTAATALVALLGFVATLLEQRNRVLRERNHAEAVSGWLLELFELPSPTRAQGESVTARELLDKGARSIVEQQGMDPELRGDLLATMGETYTRLGLVREGIELLEQSLQHLRGSPHRKHAERGDRLHALAHALIVSGDFERAEEVARQSLEFRDALPEDLGARAARAQSMAQLAHIVDLRGHPAKAERLFEPAVRVARQADDPIILARVLRFNAELRMRQGQPSRARPLFREALKLLLERHGERHPDVALLRSSLASAEQYHDPDAARRLFESAIEVQREVFGGAHPVLATALNNYGTLLYERHLWLDAKAAFEEALEMQTELYGDQHVKVASNLGNLANTERRLGRTERAAELYRRSIDVYQQQVGEEHPALALALGNLGELYIESGELDQAGGLFDRGLAITREHLGEDHPQLVTLLNGRGQLHLARGDAEAAALALGNAVDIADRSLGDGHPVLAPALINLSVAHRERGQLATAITALDRALRLTEPGVERWKVETSLADLFLRTERWANAEEHARRAWEGWRQEVGPDSVWTLSAQSILGRALMRQGRLAEAEPVLLEVLERLERTSTSPTSRLRRAIEHVAELFAAQGDAARAESYERRLRTWPE